jgi:hypothetical protein
MHQTITCTLWNKREIEASSMGIGTLRGYNSYQPPDCNPQTGITNKILRRGKMSENPDDNFD